MVTPLMPKATAVWLVENTSLSFDQIAGPQPTVTPAPPPTAVPLGQVTLWVADCPGAVGPVAELLVIMNVRGAPWAPCAP